MNVIVSNSRTRNPVVHSLADVHGTVCGINTVRWVERQECVEPNGTVSLVSRTKHSAPATFQLDIGDVTCKRCLKKLHQQVGKSV